MDASDKKERKVNCCVCTCDLAVDHVGIRCVQGHDMCTDCSRHFVRCQLNVGPSGVPLKCSICHTPLKASVVERQMNSLEMQEYQCPYAELRTCECMHPIYKKFDPINPFLACKFEGIDPPPVPDGEDPPRGVSLASIPCQKVSCIVCKLHVVNVHDAEERLRHVTCLRLAADKFAFDDALDLLHGHRRCPACHLKGMKDNACTHMNCDNCATKWCYACGLAVEDCDKAPRVGEQASRPDEGCITLHNVGWEENERRCPWFLNEIERIDPAWKQPQDCHYSSYPQWCNERLHRVLVLKDLNTLYKQLGQRRWDEVIGHFKTLANDLQGSGISLEEVLGGDHTRTFIQRS